MADYVKPAAPDYSKMPPAELITKTIQRYTEFQADYQPGSVPHALVGLKLALLNSVLRGDMEGENYCYGAIWNLMCDDDRCIGAYWGNPVSPPMVRAYVSAWQSGDYYYDDPEGKAFCDDLVALFNKHGITDENRCTPLTTPMGESANCDGIVGWAAGLSCYIASCLSGYSYGWSDTTGHKPDDPTI